MKAFYKNGMHHEGLEMGEGLEHGDEKYHNNIVYFWGKKTTNNKSKEWLNVYMNMALEFWIWSVLTRSGGVFFFFDFYFFRF